MPYTQHTLPNAKGYNTNWTRNYRKIESSQLHAW